MYIAASFDQTNDIQRIETTASETERLYNKYKKFLTQWYIDPDGSKDKLVHTISINPHVSETMMKKIKEEFQHSIPNCNFTIKEPKPLV